MIVRLDTTRLTESARAQAEQLDAQCRRVQAALSSLAGAIPSPSDKGFEHTHTAALVALTARELMDVSAKLFECASALNVIGRVSEETLHCGDVDYVGPAAPISARRKAPKAKATRAR